MKHMNPKLTRLLFEGFSINTLENLNNDQLTVLYERVKKSKKETKEETTTTVKKYNLGDKGDKDKFLDLTKSVTDKNKVNFDPKNDTASVAVEGEIEEKSVSRKQKLSLLWKGPYHVIEKNSDINYTVAHTVTGKTLRVHVKRMRAYKPYMVDNFREIIDSDGSHMRTYEEDLFQSQQGGFQLARIHVTSNPCFEMRTLKLKKGGNVTNYARRCVKNAYECEI